MGVYGQSLYGSGLYGEPLGNIDGLCVEIYLATQWLAISDYVRTEQGISYQRGYAPDSTNLAPGSCRFTLDNRSGDFSPRKSGSVVEGFGRNLPVRVGLGPGRPVGRGGKSLVGASTSVIAAGPVDDTGVASTQICAYAAIGSAAWTPPAGMTERNEDAGVNADFMVCDIPDANGDFPNQTATWGTTAVYYATLNVGLPGTWTYQLAAQENSGTTIGLAVDTADGEYVFVGQAWSADDKNAMVPPYLVGDFQPEWVMVADSGASAGPRYQGWWAKFPAGTYTVAVVGDFLEADTYGFLYQSSDSPAYSPRFTGVVREWPVSWDKTSTEATIDIDAVGGLYLGRQDADIQSPARTVLTRFATHYWPMEDSGGPGFTAATPGTPRMVASATGGITTEPVYGTDARCVGSLPLATFTDAGARASGFAAVEVGSTGATVGCVFSCPSGGAGAGANILVAYTSGSISSVGVEYTSNTQLTVKVTRPGGSTTSTVVSMAGLPGGGIDGKTVGLLFSLIEDAWSLVVYEATWANGFTSDFVSSGFVTETETFGTVTSVEVGYEVGTGQTLLVLDPAIGHVFVGPFGIAQGIVENAYLGSSQAGQGLWVQFGAHPIRTTLTVTLESATETDQGPLLPGSGGDRLQSMADTVQALCFDSAGFVGANWIDRSVAESSVVAYEFDYTAGQLTDPLEPLDDDQATVNRVRVQRPSPWGEALYEARTGTLGVEEIGPYSRTVDAFPNTTTQTEELAQWLVALGTVDAQRWPAVTVEWSAPGNAANYSLPDLTIGRWITLTNLPDFVGPDVELQIVGIREEYDSARIRTTYVTRPAEGWRVLVWDDSVYGFWADGDDPSPTDNRWAL